MSELVTAIGTGIIAFTATNIDDLFILLLFFSQVNSTFTRQHIVIGQYLGVTALVIVSLTGLFGGLILPRRWIGLLGLIPIAIGISTWINPQKDSLNEKILETEDSKRSIFAHFLSPQVYGVAAITIANGSDNISVYVPLFANSTFQSFFIIIIIFFLLLGFWCYGAYRLTSQKEIANLLTGYSSQFLPFLLIFLGIFIVLNSGALSPIKLFVSSLCLTILVKDDEVEM
jgi:cadmium resistance transport/sequestration family protein